MTCSSRLTLSVSGCSGSSLTASRMVWLCTANSPSPSCSVSSIVVFITFSLSEAVMVSTLSFTWKRKQLRMGNEFLLLMTLERESRRLLSAELERLNLMGTIFFYLFILIPNRLCVPLDGAPRSERKPSTKIRKYTRSGKIGAKSFSIRPKIRNFAHPITREGLFRLGNHIHAYQKIFTITYQTWK